jgi:predicted nucleic acid-binding protein
VTFWDTSAVIPLLVDEPASPSVRSILARETRFAVWWTTPVECCSALERRCRLQELTEAGLDQAKAALEQLRSAWTEILPSELVRDRACRLLAVHDLRASDALQLAAALLWAGDRPAGRRFLCLDNRLRAAARREGFRLEP